MLSVLRALMKKSARRLVLEEPIPESGVRCCYLKEVYLGSSRTPEAWESRQRSSWADPI